MLEILAEAEPTSAGIDLRLSVFSTSTEAVGGDRRRAIDLRPPTPYVFLAMGNKGSWSSSSISGGGGEATNLIVLGLSRMEMFECRRGTHTVEAGDGGNASSSSISSGCSDSCPGAMTSGGTTRSVDWVRERRLIDALRPSEVANAFTVCSGPDVGCGARNQRIPHHTHLQSHPGVRRSQRSSSYSHSLISSSPFGLAGARSGSSRFRRELPMHRMRVMGVR
jgi:hypothetical protein